MVVVAAVVVTVVVVVVVVVVAVAWPHSYVGALLGVTLEWC